jgi:GNAT superfamily N-acetyltransferase
MAGKYIARIVSTSTDGRSVQVDGKNVSYYLFLNNDDDSVKWSTRQDKRGRISLVRKVPAAVLQAALGAREVEDNPTLTPKDKKVIDAFVRRRKLDGKVLMSDGRTLRRGFLGAEDVAVWVGDRIVETSTESTSFDQTILSYLHKVAKASKVLVVSGYGKPVYAKGLHLFMGSDVLYPGQLDGWVVAYVPGKSEPVGRLDYSVYDSRYSIKMVEVVPEFRRYGVATAMYKHLFKQEGITWKDVDRGMFTEEGYALRKAIDPAGSGGTMMLDADLSMYLTPKGKVPTIGPETGRKVANGIARYVSPHGSVRYVSYVEGQPVSVLQVVSMDGKTAKVANVFTEIEYRRKGLAAKLMKRARKDFAKVEHSEHLTASGAKWAKKNPYGRG